jgi:hypothetical protein
LTVYLAYEKGDPPGWRMGNIRNGYSRKRLKTDDGNVESRFRGIARGASSRSWC